MQAYPGGPVQHGGASDGVAGANSVSSYGGSTVGHSSGPYPSAGRRQQGALSMDRRFFSGIIKMIDVERNCGFIECSEMNFLYGQDVYVHGGVLERTQASVGDIVCFPVRWSAKGQPQAAQPVLRLAADNGYALVGTFREGAGGRDRFGFIECPELKGYFGRDVYVNSVIAVNLAAGMRCAFNAYLNKDLVPNTLSAQQVDDSFQVTPGDLSQSRCAPDYEGPKRPGGNCSYGTSAPGYGNPQWPIGERFWGVLRKYDPNKNYGFIGCDETFAHFGKDVFLHAKHLSENMNICVGAALSFTLAVSAEGQPQAMEVMMEIDTSDSVGVRDGNSPSANGQAGGSLAEFR